MTDSTVFILLCGLIVLVAALFIAVIIIGVRAAPKAGLLAVRDAINGMSDAFNGLSRDGDRFERKMLEDLSRHRAEAAENERGQRTEQANHYARLAQAIGGRMSQIAQVQGQQIESLTQTLTLLSRGNEERFDQLRATIDAKLGEVTADQRAGREESATSFMRFGVGLIDRMSGVAAASEKQIVELRGMVEERLVALQNDNAKKLDEMRLTVDEKLHQTLETRLAQSFKQVSDRLEQVHRGLGEMQSLAIGVGDLKRVLTNVKTRGNWGEVQLGGLLEDLLAPGQFERQVEIRKGSGERVDFAIRLPGRQAEADVLYLPIDAKFPQEDYQRLVDAQERADVTAIEEHSRQLDARIKLQAKSIHDKYIEAPRTTDFAILFLPTEGLYAEVLRRPALAESVQREFRVMVAGPTTLAALLNSLQMGFRTLAIEKRSAEVWALLGAVKSDFGKFGLMLARTREKLEQATKTIGDAEHRSRQIERTLKKVESLPTPEAQAMLTNEAEGDGEDEDAAALPPESKAVSTETKPAVRAVPTVPVVPVVPAVPATPAMPAIPAMSMAPAPMSAPLAVKPPPKVPPDLAPLSPPAGFPHGLMPGARPVLRPPLETPATAPPSIAAPPNGAPAPKPRGTGFGLSGAIERAFRRPTDDPK